MRKISAIFLMAFIVLGTSGFALANEQVVDLSKVDNVQIQKVGFFENIANMFKSFFGFENEATVQKTNAQFIENQNFIESKREKVINADAGFVTSTKVSNVNAITPQPFDLGTAEFSESEIEELTRISVEELEQIYLGILNSNLSDERKRIQVQGIFDYLESDGDEDGSGIRHEYLRSVIERLENSNLPQSVKNLVKLRFRDRLRDLFGDEIFSDDSDDSDVQVISGQFIRATRVNDMNAVYPVAY
ncbi:MAG: hypothetical protein ABIF88_03555 [archaeon]